MTPGTVLQVVTGGPITELLTSTAWEASAAPVPTAIRGPLFVTTASTWNGNIILNPGTQIGPSGPTSTVNGSLSGADLTKTGAGTLTLNANNTFTGNLNDTSGTVVVANANTYSGTTTVGTGASLTLNNSRGILPNTSGITVNGGTLTLDDNAGNNNLGNRLNSAPCRLTFNGGFHHHGQ